MPKEVVITAIRHKTNPNDSDIRFTRRFVWRDKPSFKKFINDYCEGMLKRLYRVAGNGKRLEVTIEEN